MTRDQAKRNAEYCRKNQLPLDFFPPLVPLGTGPLEPEHPCTKCKVAVGFATIHKDDDSDSSL